MLRRKLIRSKGDDHAVAAPSSDSFWLWRMVRQNLAADPVLLLVIRGEFTLSRAAGRLSWVLAFEVLSMDGGSNVSRSSCACCAICIRACLGPRYRGVCCPSERCNV